MTMDERNREIEPIDLFREQERTSTLDELLAQPFSSPAVSRAEEADKPTSVLETLKPEHREKALALAKQIDPANQQAILQYGVAAQAELSKFSHTILHHVQTKDAGPVGEVISELMAKIKEVNPDDLMPAKKDGCPVCLVRWPNRCKESWRNTKKSASKLTKSPTSLRNTGMDCFAM